MPLLSGTASGKLGKKLVYSMRHNSAISRNFHYPNKAPSGEQLAQRYIIGLLTARWQTMTAGEKAPYIAGALASEKKNGKPLTGFNYWIKTAMSDLYTHYGMIAFYPFNEGSGHLVKDYSGNAIHFSLLPYSPSASLQFVPSENKKFSSAISNTALSRYGLATYNSKMNFTTEFSYFGYIKLYAKAGTRSRFFLCSNWANILQFTDNSIQFKMTLGGNSRTRSVVANDYVANRWYFFCLTFKQAASGNNFKLYLNSKLYSQVFYAGGGGTPTDNLYLMCSGPTSDFANGALDNLCFVKRELSLAEIQKINGVMKLNKERQNLP